MKNSRHGGNRKRRNKIYFRCINLVCNIKTSCFYRKFTVKFQQHWIKKQFNLKAHERSFTDLEYIKICTL